MSFPDFVLADGEGQQRRWFLRAIHSKKKLEKRVQ